jgi:hypothetical protein
MTTSNQRGRFSRQDEDDDAGDPEYGDVLD